MSFGLSSGNKAQLLLHLGKGLARVVGCLVSALLHLCLKGCLVAHQLGKARLNGSQSIGSDLTDRQLKVAVALAVKLALDLGKVLAGKAGVDGHQVVDAVLALGKAHAGIGVGHGTAELADNGVLVVQNVYDRILIFIVFQCIAIFYVMRYARRIKADPTKSFLYGTKLNMSQDGMTREQLMALKMNKKNIACCVVFLITVFFLVFGTIQWGWYISELSGLFIIAMIVSGVVGGMNANEIAQSFVRAAKDMMFGAMVIGLSRGIVVVLNNGNVIDTIIHGLSTPLMTMGEALGNLGHYVTALGMLVVQNIVNFFIGSGSGQASAVMPIMAPLADMVGLTRQTAVLAFQFGDGYSNLFWPSGIFLISGLMGAPADKWFRYVAPLFGMGFILQCIFMVIAVAIGF